MSATVYDSPSFVILHPIEIDTFKVVHQAELPSKSSIISYTDIGEHNKYNGDLIEYVSKASGVVVCARLLDNATPDFRKVLDFLAKDEENERFLRIVGEDGIDDFGSLEIKSIFSKMVKMNGARG